VTPEQRDPGDSQTATELAEVLRTLSRFQGPPAASLLGEARPSELAEEFFRVEPTRFPAFAAIELRPWTAAKFGVAFPELARTASWSLSDLADLLGPLEEGSRTQRLGPELQGFLDDPALPARAVVYVILAADDPDSPVDHVRIRIESR
jgi:hypothetical protein